MIGINDSNMYREIHDQHRHVADCLRLNADMMKKSAKEVKERNIKSVVLVGRGSSDHANLVGRYAFEMYTDMVATIAAPSVVTMYNGKVDYSNSLVIGISQCGQAQDVYEVLKRCDDQGGIAVSITNVRDCLMATLKEYYMNCECGEEKSFTACKSYLTQMTILLGLVAEISGDASLKEALEKAPSVIEKCYEIEEQVRAILPMYRNANQVYLYGRGLLNALANEAELKIIESAYLDARCYGSSDFYHGPISMTPRFMPNIFYVADTLTNQSTMDLHNKLRSEKQLYTTVVTNVKEYAEMADHSVVLPEECDGILGVYGCAIFSQLFACLLAIERGYNPDFPVGLSKVTVTR
jgi:glucosamine--fructose-6-phosphate aminotransferase (isomerizing)